MDQEKKEKNQQSLWDFRVYMPVILAVIVIIAVSIVIFFAVFRIQVIGNSLKTLFTTLQAIVIGFVLAYLLNPIMKFFEDRYRRLFYKKTEILTGKQRKHLRAISVATTMLVFLAAITVLLGVLVPQIVSSVEDLIASFNTKINNLESYLNKFVKNNPNIEAQVTNITSQIATYTKTWLKKTFLSGNTEWFTTITTGIMSVVKAVFNTIVGLIVCVYILLRKEIFIGQAKKINYAFFSPRKGNIVMEVVRKANSIFGGYFVGMIIGAIFVGVICLIGMIILKMPYAPLIALIIAFTNVIPMFGPYLGAIPSAILILSVSPVKAIIFLIFILALQQFDGNVMNPKIIGDNIGMSPFWVIFAVMFFGKGFGLVGMVVGVPIFAMVYYIIKRVVEHCLRKRKLPDDTVSYIDADIVDRKTNRIIKKR